MHGYVRTETEYDSMYNYTIMTLTIYSCAIDCCVSVVDTLLSLGPSLLHQMCLQMAFHYSFHGFAV